MKIAALHIANFKAAKSVDLENIGDVVVIAGPNGCGKSCILDAIRFLKSVYAGYKQQNEWHNFFNEFMVNMQSPEDVRRLFMTRQSPLQLRLNLFSQERK